MKNKDAGYDYMYGIISTSDINTVSSFEADDIFIIATYLIATSVDIN